MGDKIVPMDGARAQVSGRQIVEFNEGWAVAAMIGPGGKAHHFKRRQFDHDAVSACGVTSPVVWLFHAGSYHRCKICDRRLKSKAGPKAEVVSITDTSPSQ